MGNFFKNIVFIIDCNLKDLLSCNIKENKWYELIFYSSIQYEIYQDSYYHQFWANYSTTFIFKTEKYVERNGTELFWLQRLVELKTKYYLHVFCSSQSAKHFKIKH